MPFAVSFFQGLVAKSFQILKTRMKSDFREYELSLNQEESYNQSHGIVEPAAFFPLLEVHKIMVHFITSGILDSVKYSN